MSNKLDLSNFTFMTFKLAHHWLVASLRKNKIFTLATWRKVKRVKVRTNLPRALHRQTTCPMTTTSSPALQVSTRSSSRTTQTLRGIFPINDPPTWRKEPIQQGFIAKIIGSHWSKNKLTYFPAKRSFINLDNNFHWIIYTWWDSNWPTATSKEGKMTSIRGQAMHWVFASFQESTT